MRFCGCEGKNDPGLALFFPLPQNPRLFFAYDVGIWSTTNRARRDSRNGELFTQQSSESLHNPSFI